MKLSPQEATRGRTLHVLSCATYTVTVAAENRVGRSNPVVKQADTKGCPRTLPAPEVDLVLEKRSWGIDDPDVVVQWSKVPRANSQKNLEYQLDWRYVDLDITRLKQLYNRLEFSSSESVAASLLQEINYVLDVTEVPVHKIGNPKPGSVPLAGSLIEVRCWPKSEEPQCSAFSVSDTLTRNERVDPDDMRFRIHSVSLDYTLQVRVRAFGGDNVEYKRAGEWSRWTDVDNSIRYFNDEVAPCANVTVVWARGSDQDLLPLSDREPRDDKLEGAKFFNDFRDRIRRIRGVKYNFYELGNGNHGYKIYERYPAVNATNEKLTLIEGGLKEGGNEWPAQFKQLRGAVLRDHSYVESVYLGMHELEKYLANRVAQCPDERFVLAGYSQGAHAISKALSGTRKRLVLLKGKEPRGTLASFSPERLLRLLKERVAFIALFGDPTFACNEGEDLARVGALLADTFRDPTFAHDEGEDRVRPSWVRGNPPDCPFSGSLESYEKEEDRAGYLPTDMKHLVGSWCDDSDPICTGQRREFSIGPFGMFGPNTHGKYGDPSHTKADGGTKTWIEEAAQLAASKFSPSPR